MRICINIFNCHNCRMRWLVRWPHIDFSICIECGAIVTTQDKRFINTDYKYVKSVLSKGDIIHAYCRAPHTKVVEKFPYK